ncbi:Txe/YoeB family addiction module toxin [Staphylococcus haemolyticus]|uniref:Txe/YoeB family addiction module toxin n=1 Tax=Staphylococcus haemolyticus TaxID=1283 RepID=UPI0015D7A33B|nr:Txe/YoeB family addiction module toxin [Staphylococcus haemolyticus]
MSKYSIIIHISVKEDLKKLKQSRLMNEAITIINTLKYDPYEDSQSYTKLLSNKFNYYSRRISYEHRMIYKVNEENKEVLILSLWSYR